ncbi:MAG TPA: TonB family protein [Vicinamibacteria bacterium]|nr:TonB family protein [Vicinamibacteria bacterium]
MMRRASLVAALLLAPLAAPALRAQDEPLTAGSPGVPAPKRTKTVAPEYPVEAQAQGIRGIVILELTIDKEGKVADVKVIRSVPGLDEAALDAARQWSYAVTKVDGKPVSVRVTVPITFAMKLPEMTRQEGVPELRQGVSPPYPQDAKGPATVVADVTLDSEGRVAEATMVQGEAPWTSALVAALRTWRFAADAPSVTVSFRVQADFLPGERKDPPRVNLRLDGLRRSESMAGGPGTSGAPTPAPATAPATGAASEDAPATSAESAPAAGATSGAPPPATGAASEAPAPPAGASEPPATPAATAATASGAQAPSSPATDPPPVEVISAPPPPPPPAEVESGTSVVRDVTLDAGVPDLVRGRRPVPPPFARMAGTSGTVEVQFSVSAAGTCLVQSANGPDLLRPAAEQTVASWQFRRTQAQRLFLAAVFRYEGDRAAAVVRPQPPPPPAAPEARAPLP